ncbi:FAD-dependent oxidoreductase [Blastococcus sp. SYSU D00820]
MDEQGTAAQGTTAQGPPAGGDFDAEYDVVVVGSGAGALTGAYVAAAGGRSTVVLEATDRLGGTSAYSGAACWLPGTQVQQRAGLEDSTEGARTYLRALLGEGTADRQDAFLEQAPRLVELLERDPVIEFRFQAFPDYFDAPGRLDQGRSFIPVDLPAEEIGELAALVRPPVDRDRVGADHAPAPLVQGRALIGRLLLAYTRTGNGAVRTGTRVTGLVVDADRVVGVTAETAEGTVRIRARGGVLLAAGGFERNAARRAEHGVPGAAEWSMAPAGTNTGEAIAAAEAIGAATDLLGEGWFCPGLAQPDGGAAFTLGLRGGVLVDATGNRFANECLPYDRMGREMAKAPERVPAWLVFDSREGGRLPAISIPTLPREEHLAAGTWVTADTVAELAGLIGVPAGALTATVERFNGFAAEGVDADFGRGEDPYDRFFAAGQGPNPCLVPLEQGPFTAARVVLSDLGTKGGLVTDARARVLRADGTPIRGLYAAGNSSASLAGPVYPGPGVPIGTAMAFSSIAVQDMAEDLLPA